ncbi:uncharacterized protein TRUGW13939_03027 [Talaromyces rugulosus]|uniref:Major facilitator superfamily (MFS) profile domain-containing protein n=1 Tax=Talaromyces rugulosus TaxID=121627 RepID=A0A7H8QPX3_TALRU|nr:uncharacterized protein TRUGW13939_03027 [Talaromyces rugulosus]QKX55928.1 hypothetical protein TRUGW13939_03027 [Talaromyces rugulosus]
MAIKNRSGGINFHNVLVTIAVSFGSLTYGYSSSIISSTIGQPGWYSFFNLPSEGEPGYGTTTTNAIATANGLYSAGGAVGSLFIMWSASAIGRKRNIQLGSLLVLLGGALQAGATNLNMFQAGRFIAGLGVGNLVTICPMYLSEISPPQSRGFLVGHHAIFLVFGYMLSAWLGFACYFATEKNPSFAWRFPLSMQCFGPLVLFLSSIFITDSSRWLLQQGRAEEAWTVLKKLRSNPSDPDDLAIREEMYQIKQQLALEQARLQASGCNPWTAVLKKRSYRKRMIIGFLTQWGAEFGGPLVINNYFVILCTNLGQTGYMPLLLSAVWLTTAGLIYNPFGAWLHDRVNSRRWMFIVGFMGCLVTTSGLAGCIAQYSGTSNKGGNAAGLFFIFLYLAFQGSCCDTTMYLYISEIFPMEIRGIGMGFSLFGQFAATLVLLQTAPIGIQNVGWKYYLVIICWCIFFIPVVYLFWPETAQLSLEEIASQFGDDVAVQLHGLPENQRRELDDFLREKDITHMEEVVQP